MNKRSHWALTRKDELGTSASCIGAFSADEVSPIDGGHVSQTSVC